MSFDSVWMNAETAARYLDITCKEPAEAFRVWAKRHGVPTARDRCPSGDRSRASRAAIGALHLTQRKTA